MGTLWAADRADLTPVFTAIFRRLAAHGCDWTYTFPRIHVVDFGDLDALPFAARRERERQRTEMDETIEQGHREALEAAKDRPPPATVEAYRRIFGGWPRGWPPWEEAGGTSEPSRGMIRPRARMEVGPGHWLNPSRHAADPQGGRR